MSDTPKFLSKQELEPQEVKYIYSLRAERDELQEQLNTAKKALTEISEVKNLTPFKKGFETSKAVSKARDMRNTARQALAAIGGDGCPAGPVGKNGLTKEELEWSGDE